MSERPDFVASYGQVVENVLQFNEQLRGSVGLQRRLSHFRAWYYIPEKDAVGPSIFIGYQGMTAERCLEGGLDGRDTEAAACLPRWFNTLQEGTPEYRRISEKVSNLLEGFGKKPSRRARFNVPR